jgi:hypothetical protein
MLPLRAAEADRGLVVEAIVPWHSLYMDAA